VSQLTGTYYNTLLGIEFIRNVILENVQIHPHVTIGPKKVSLIGFTLPTFIQGVEWIFDFGTLALDVQ
jgi:hypothetical protein